MAVLSLQLDLSQPLEEQGPLDVIIHKLTDLILEADQNDSQAMLLVQRVQVRPVVFCRFRRGFTRNKNESPLARVKKRKIDYYFC